ncbi:hypothetical protein D0817_15070 [Flavobacterium cupreum]|uniref:Signal transduction histidine kinase dimerisation/phosphoacceptor domain-containing protein n=1 Tax=Flavobacterium cupreum TaxID=2133766 RepID=A0A434A516_9FLAO|nr:hypothetical protein [Flavobacterium cupreum]RUT69501.1 hypothetical protein D0817_15070 [Flavobacterium cupreum]
MDQNVLLAKLKIAEQQLIFYQEELEGCARRLKIATINLKIRETEEKVNKQEFNSNLDQMMFSVSHKLRKSVANILGLSEMLNEDLNLGNNEVREILLLIIQSAESLNFSTKELSDFICLNKRN